MVQYAPYKPANQGGINIQDILAFINATSGEEQGQQGGGSISGLSSLLGGAGGGAGTSTLIGGGGGAAGTGASLAANNAGMLAANSPSYLSGFSAGMPSATTGTGAAGLGSVASVALPAAAVLYGAYRGNRMYNNLKDSEGGFRGIKKGFKEGLKPANLAIFGTSGPLIGSLMGAFGHKSTKQRQGDKWNDLYSQGKVPDWFMQQDVTQDQGVDDNKIASGKLGGRDVWATSAFFDQFGKGWSNAGDENKREQVAKRILDEGLLDTKKGLTRFTNKDRTQAIFNEVMGGGATTPSKILGPQVTPSKDLSAMQSQPWMRDSRNVINNPSIVALPQMKEDPALAREKFKKIMKKF